LKIFISVAAGTLRRAKIFGQKKIVVQFLLFVRIRERGGVCYNMFSKIANDKGHFTENANTEVKKHQCYIKYIYALFSRVTTQGTTFLTTQTYSMSFAVFAV
jgi:hypothetical protein